MKTIRYIHQHRSWPNFIWDGDALLSLIGLVRSRQGKLIGQMESIGFNLKSEATLETLTTETVKSSEIEGEILNPEQVRSSIARRLGLDIPGLVTSDRYIDGIVEMMLDATQKYNKPLSAERLFNWHSALFPTGRSGIHKIIAGNWRNDKTGPMQVVSGIYGKEKVHFQAPDASRLREEMANFIKWFNKKDGIDPVLRAGIAHLWFITLHPFDDGNGRIARAITDMQLSKADESSQRFYSMSAQIRMERKKYYDILEKTQKGNLDITEWLKWFLKCLMDSINLSSKILEKVLFKAKFWEMHSTTILNNRQILLLNKILDGFEGKLTTSKWAKIAKCSADTALRDIQYLTEKKILSKESSGGRSTSYVITN